MFLKGTLIISDIRSSINRKELLIFRKLIVQSLLCSLSQSASLWARKRFAKNGAETDPIGIPIEEKQLCKRNFIASLINDLVKTKLCPLS